MIPIQTMPTPTNEASASRPPAPGLEAPKLAALALLREFGESDRTALQAAGTIVQVAEGERVITQGEQHGAVFIILAGRFAVTQDEGTVVAEIGVGQICGEMEMLNPPHSMANVTALMEATIWRITREELRGFMVSHPSAGQAFMKLLTSTFAARLTS